MRQTQVMRRNSWNRQNTVTDWVRKYKADGLDGLKESRGCKAYSEDLQLAAIRDVRSHSIREGQRSIIFLVKVF
ncbi:hypothetical protein P7H22_16430 [Paenibacillus larvae]|nr:hypothetical protein [Paenibacillus larvae]MDT2241622.1 hypothetical protein [Paenibacillus larvae]